MSAILNLSKTLQKGMLDSHGRKLKEKITADEIKTELVENPDDVFGLPDDLSQEEKIIRIAGYSQIPLRRYIEKNNADYPTINRQTPLLDVVSELFENLYGETLTEKSEEVVALLTLSAAELKKRSGYPTWERARQIRFLMGMNISSDENIRQLKERLENYGFKIEITPSPRNPEKPEHYPFSDAGMIKAINQGKDVSDASISRLSSILGEFSIFEFDIDLTEREIRDFVKELAIYSPLPSYKKIKSILNRKPRNELDMLMGLYGYPGLDIKDLNFFFTRGYIVGVVNYELANEDLQDAIADSYDGTLPSGEDFKNLPENESADISRLIYWNTLSPEELYEVVKSRGISIPYPDTDSFWKESMVYTYIDYLKTFDSDDRPPLKNIGKYSDQVLLKYFPNAPFGRKALIKAFKSSWTNEKIFYLDGYKKGDWENWESIDPDWENETHENLINIIPWLGVGPEKNPPGSPQAGSPQDPAEVHGNELTRINTIILSRIGKMNPEELGLPKRDELPNDFVRYLNTIVEIVEFEYGSSEDQRVRERAPPKIDTEDQKKMIKKYTDILTKKFLRRFPLFDMISLEKLEDNTLYDVLNSEYDWLFLESAIFYLALYYTADANKNFILSRS